MQVTITFCKFSGKDKQFVVTLPQEERVTWIWVIIFAFFVPEIQTFFRSFRICCFKTWDMPEMKVVLTLVFTESFPAIGSSLLVFGILPNLDVVKGVMLTNAVCFVPALIGNFYFL